jgi:hypothetical protein
MLPFLTINIYCTQMVSKQKEAVHQEDPKDFLTRNFFNTITQTNTSHMRNTWHMSNLRNQANQQHFFNKIRRTNLTQIYHFHMMST